MDEPYVLTGRTEAERRAERKRIAAELERRETEQQARVNAAGEWAERWRLPKDWPELVDLYRGITVAEILDQFDNITDKKGNRQ